MDGYLTHNHPESDERQQQLSTCSDRQVEPWNDPKRALLPAGRDDFRRELTACLSLSAPSGMAQDDRNEWLRVAWGTLQGIPADLLARGCAAARKQADHPAKIVPAILREVEQAWAWRREQGPKPAARDEPRPDPNYCSPAEAAAILREFGLKPTPNDPHQLNEE